MIALAIALLAAPTGGWTDPAALDAEIAAFTGVPIGDVGGAAQQVDPRLKLQLCSVPHAVSWRDETRRTLVVRCPSGPGWRVFVPAVQGQTPIAAVTRPAEPEAAIHRGDAVGIEVGGAGFTVTRRGEALEDGALGETIRVRPASDTRRAAATITARVIGPGTVAPE